MASRLYGVLRAGHSSQMLPVAASQYFYHNGVPLVYLDGSGHVTLALTADTTVYGIAVVPGGMGAGASNDYWLSSATAGKDEIPVIPVSENALFLLPADATPTIAQMGDACDHIAVNDGTATTVDVGTSSTDLFLIKDIGSAHGGPAASVVVQINPAKVQADT